MEDLQINVTETEESVIMSVRIRERVYAREPVDNFTKSDAIRELARRGHVVKNIKDLAGPDLLTNYTSKVQSVQNISGTYILMKEVKEEKKQTKVKNNKIKAAPKTSNRRTVRAKRGSTQEPPSPTTRTIED